MPTTIAHRIAAARLHGQFLLGTSPHKTAADVVRAQVAVQSQDYPGGKWGIAQRAQPLTDAMIDAAFDRGEIVRTHVLRPTWHFVMPEDLGWLLMLTGPRISQQMMSYNRKMGLDASVFRKSRRVIEKTIAANGHATRAELKTALQRAGVDGDGTQRMAHIVMQAELDGVICSGARRGTNSTYALVSERVPNPRRLARDEALGELAVRYFATRSPATVHDFSWWSGLTIGECKRAVDIAGKALVSPTLDEKNYVAAASFELPKRVPSSTHLLPNYDEYFIGFRDRSAIGHRLSSHALVTGGTSLISHVVEVDGQLVGGWRRSTGATPELKFDILVELANTEQKRIRELVRRFASFLEKDVSTVGL